MEQVINSKGEKEWARSTKLEPKQADDILFEMMIHGWIDQQHNLHVTKYTLPELASVMPDGAPITLETGRKLWVWAADNEPEEIIEWDSRLQTAAHNGLDALAAEWKLVPRHLQTALKPNLDTIHKPAAAKVAA
jgi:hypothetical protein